MTDRTPEPYDVTVNARLSKSDVQEIDDLAEAEDRIATLAQQKGTPVRRWI
ncbi:hypothetical protein AB0H63_15685 [Micromonospora echinospora]|uniref:hypothetical protein n=1 Tax=Micromonospora echinospora TaxID=1877 RepID=UPI0034066B13